MLDPLGDGADKFAVGRRGMASVGDSHDASLSLPELSKLPLVGLRQPTSFDFSSFSV